MQQTLEINSLRDVVARCCGDGECKCVSSVNRSLSTFLDFVVIPAASTAAVVAFLQLTNPITHTDTTLQGAAQVEQVNQLAA